MINQLRHRGPLGFSKVLLLVLFLLLASSCVKRDVYQIGEEGTISRNYYNGCMGLIELGKQFAGSIRSSKFSGSEDACGCQAELIFKQGIFVAQEPLSGEFLGCAKRLGSSSADYVADAESSSIPAQDSPRLIFSPMFIVLPFSVIVGIVFLLLRSRDEE
jgi:hypothetical protein